MIASDWHQVRRIFEEALSLPAAERREFLEQACGNRQEIKAEVERFLEAEERLYQSGFLDKPVWEWEYMEKANQAHKVIDLPFTDEDRKRYRILNIIGHGGMGIVYLGFSHERQDEVAIKVLQGDFTDENLRRFEDERKILVKLDDNQHMATFLGRGFLCDGRPYFVMKFVKGKSLESALKVGALPFHQVVEITNQLSQALAFAHQTGVVHRDIKPSNIMLSEIGGKLCVKILDFGIAILKQSEDALTKDFTRGLICTPAYASPEQAEGKRRDMIDHRSDICSLGYVVYEMLTGKHPFEGNSPELLLVKRLSEMPAPPSQIRPDSGISRAVDKVLLKAMALSLDDRYDDARRFASEFEAALLATAPARQASRWPGYLTLIIVALLLIAGGGVGLQFLNDSASPNIVSENQPTDNSNQNVTSNEIRVPDRNGNGNIPAMTLQPDLEIQLLQQTAAGETAVPFNTVFRKGDAVRWNIKPTRPGYLYIVLKGSSGRVFVFYPNPDEDQSYAPIGEDKSILFPKKSGSLKFRGPTGTETYYFVLADQKDKPSLAELEKAVVQKRVSLSLSDGQSLIAALQACVESKEPGAVVRVIELQYQ